MNALAAQILIVDDEAQNCRLLEALLRPQGYRTVCVSNGADALRQVEISAPDLILLDVMMPGMNGYEVAAALKANPVRSHIPIIMVTAQSDRAARLAGLEAGAEEFLAKPVDRAELWVRVRNLLRLKSYGDFLAQKSTVLEQQVLAHSADLLRFRSAMDAAAEAIFLIEFSSMRLIEINACASKLLGFSREELLLRGPTPLSGLTAAALSSVCAELVSGQRDNFLSDGQVACRDGQFLATAIQLTAQRFGNDWIVFAVLSDITARQKAAQWLHHLAHYDALTGLPNRALFFETLTAALTTAASSGAVIALLCLNIDHFKSVNDTLGHLDGDELLRQFSTRLVGCADDRNSLGRLGDAFLLIMEMRDGLEVAVTMANTVREALRAPFDLAGGSIVVTASAGISVYPHDANDGATLIRFAETAMAQSKRAGGDTKRFFTAQMNTDILARIELEAALRKAFLAHEFVLHYQPKVHLNSGRIAGFEALLRWERPGHGVVPPSEFIAVLEACGLIIEVGAWAMEQACRQLAQWTALALDPVQVSVNVSGRQLALGNLEADVSQALGRSGIRPDQLELELTESTLMENVERTLRVLTNVRSRGVKISIDDFGTGYSSLAYLRRFPVDALKIDIAFVRDVTCVPDAAAIVSAIIRMAHSLKLVVVAEGVESAAQLAALRRHRCDHIQGYHFSRPLCAAAAEAILREGRRLPQIDRSGREAGETLLLLDDDAVTLAALQRTFIDEGYAILTASSAAEAFELLALHEVQIIVCDQLLPDAGAGGFLGQVKDLYPDTHRILLSHHTDPATMLDAINCGAVDRFFAKPWDPGDLRNKIRAAFDQRWQRGAAP